MNLDKCGRSNDTYTVERRVLVMVFVGCCISLREIISSDRKSVADNGYDAQVICFWLKLYHKLVCYVSHLQKLIIKRVLGI